MLRRAGLVSRREGTEVLVIDLESQTAHCLREDVAKVWEAIETPGSIDTIAAYAGLAPDDVSAALEELRSLGLLAGTRGVSRRVLARGAALGGAVIAAGVVSIPLPAAARANSSMFTVSRHCNYVVDVLGAGLINTSADLTIARTGGATLTPGAIYACTLVYQKARLLQASLTTTVQFNATAKADGTGFASVGMTSNESPAGSVSVSAGAIVYTTGSPVAGGAVTVTVGNNANDQKVGITTGTLTSC